jgi:hypothetical protein
VRRIIWHLLLLLGVSLCMAESPSPPPLRIGILGDPVHQVPWTDDALERLEAAGFNAVQLNLAWGSRPYGEALNLIDVVTVPGESEVAGTAERRAELRRRLELAKRHGLRTLFSFGSPYMARNPATGEVTRTQYRVDDLTFDSWYDILNPAVRQHEFDLLREFRHQFPEVDDILVYTYDNDAWQTAEFQYTAFSYGIPLSERLPGYLAELHGIWTEGRAGRGRMWWEPWELSAGEVYSTLPKLPRSDFGLMLHSNIAEVQLVSPVDVWFRTTARICRTLGIPVVAEGFFASATEEVEPLAVPAPRLVDEEYLALTAVPGVIGIKEYYGINAAAFDLDTELLRSRIDQPAKSSDEILTAVTARFGPAQADVLKYLALLSDALQTYPWDASWYAREVGRASTDHGWHGAAIRGWVAPTPSYAATRRARFMKTEDTQPHFWLLEDVELRCKLAADILGQASALSGRLLGELTGAADRVYFERVESDVEVFRRVARSYSLHLRETNVAQMLRQDMDAQRPMNPGLLKELAGLLDADVNNQGGQGRVLGMRDLYKKDPRAFLQRYLVPVYAATRQQPLSRDLPPLDVPRPEKGSFTLTTR